MRLFLFATIFSIGLSVLAAPTKRASVCNGRAELCNRGYGNVTFLSSHDSFAISEDIFALARTQELDLPGQLDLGVRMLQAQSHMSVSIKTHPALDTLTSYTGMAMISSFAIRVSLRAYTSIDTTHVIYCLAGCSLFDGGLVVDYLKTVKTWLDNNPNEVLTFLFTNPEGLSLTDVWKPAFDEADITDLAYVPPTKPMKRGDWPTLGEFINSGKRVIVFLDYGVDDSVDFILSEFTMASPLLWEPPFSVTDSTFPCSVNRISGPLSTVDHLNMLNHNLNINIIPIGDGVLIPDFAAASKTNSLSSILANAYGCSGLAGGVAPNFVMLDFVNIGHGLDAVNLLNGF
ncbi:PLC-like phosphodiesterase [Desarmillaria tabescens]|uniref:PLC-like phosphodiesterase n=1 Tax=Armillaria tabescens TaxID=1929756 RepID=A0AA39KDY2_ARMTA|nr:PLC-like phosphodiesterase [Desarmillaria tabescens]KAK0458190.1 PLC-like phosphodiesterase [Desarmillaria tabescens]